jgi:Flp pilus assembly protein TadG
MRRREQIATTDGPATASFVRELIRRLWRHLRKDARGSVAAIFALTLLPLLGMVGAAVDYSRVANIKTKFEGALDAALIAAAREALDKEEPEVSRARVEALLRGVVGPRFEAHLTEVAVETLVRDGARRAVGIYRAEVGTVFAPFIGVERVYLVGQAEITLERPNYTDIFLVLDVSASMGLAADDAGRRLLAQKTLEVNGEECTFACHGKGDPSHPKTNLQIAQENNIRTRIDVTRAVSNTLLDDVKAAQGRSAFGPDVYRVGLFTFSGSGVDIGGARTLATPSASIELVRPQIGGVQLDNATAYKPMLSEMTTIIGTSQDGSSASKPRKFMIMLTDGHDYGHDWNQSKTINPIDCVPLKRNGVGLYVFNTKWVADWGNWAFDPILGYKTNPLGGGTVFEALGPKLKECSSGEGFYFEGTDANEIATTFRKIFRDIQTKLHLSR